MSTPQAQTNKKSKTGKIVDSEKVPYGAVKINGEVLYLFNGQVLKMFDYLEKINSALRLTAEYFARATRKVTYDEYEKIEALVTDVEQCYAFEKQRIDLNYAARNKFKKSVAVVKETLQLFTVSD